MGARLNHCFSTWAWNWPFALSQDWHVLALGFHTLLYHRLWAPCIMSPHQNQVCLPGPPAQPQGWTYLLTVDVRWCLRGLGVVLRYHPGLAASAGHFRRLEACY